MTLILPPAYMQNRTDHTAETDRSVANVLTLGPLSSNSLKSAGGVNMSLGGGLKVTQSGSPAMSVDIASGTCLVPGSEGATQGVYTVVNSASVTLTVTAANATLSRIDLVVVQIRDQGYSGSNNDAILAVIAGTPASSPAPPTAPADTLIIGQILVGANVTSIVNANITDRRKPIVASGGMEVCTSTTRPANGLYEGRLIYVTDLDWIEIYDGAAWRVRGVAAVAAFANLASIASPYLGQQAVTADGVIWIWTGSIWCPDHLSGTIAVTFTNQNSFSASVVTFAHPFDATPTVIMNINNGTAAVARWVTRPITISATGFTPFMFYAADGTTNTSWTSVTVQWSAFA